jgi:CubicO group peptidase (beta-lactamase class C family)
MTTPTLTLGTTKALKRYVNDATDPATANNVLPAALVHIVDAHNNVLFSHGSGPDISPNAESMGIVQSLSKVVGAMAYMQLVERGVATLDDPDTITTHLPELAAKKVLIGYTDEAETGKKSWQFDDRKEDITARMLLNHTYGGGHTYFNKLLLEYFQDLGIWAETNEVPDPAGTVLASPLLWQPGTKTNYGQGLDWIAVLIERISKQSLGAYLQNNIFEPLGLKEIGMEPMYGGDALSLTHNTGKFWPRRMRNGDDFITIDLPEPVVVQKPNAFPEGNNHTGCLGTGLVASARDYTHLLTTLLPQNSGLDPISGHRLLSPSSVREITTPQLPPHIRNNTRSMSSSSALPIILPVDLSSPHIDPEGSFGLGCGVQGADRTLRDGRMGRRKGSVYWYGATNCEFWVDGERGVAVFVSGNYYPWNEGAWMEFIGGVEGKLYEGLG